MTQILLYSCQCSIKPSCPVSLFDQKLHCHLIQCVMRSSTPFCRSLIVHSAFTQRSLSVYKACAQRLCFHRVIACPCVPVRARSHVFIHVQIAHLGHCVSKSQHFEFQRTCFVKTKYNGLIKPFSMKY